MEDWKELPLVLIHHTTSWKDLPTLLKTDILSRLPVKSLIRSTSVSKSWYTHIKKPTFISAHINRSIKNGPHHSLLFAPTASQTFTLITHNHQTKLQIPFRTHSNSVSIIGSCHGLICLADASPFLFGRDLYLWNPSVNKHKHIPSTRSCFAKELSDWTDTYPVIGFGFHKPHNDYRIVRIVYCAETPFDFIDKVTHKVEVYSLRKDCWRRVKAGVVATVTRRASHDRWAFVNGVVYWLEAKRDNSYNWILSFDFNDEVFGEVQLPPNFRDGVGRDAHAIVSDYKGLLGLCVFDVSADYGGSERLCVWVRKEDGAPERKRMVWGKQLKVVLKDRIGWPLKFTKSGELILEALEDLGPRGGARGGGRPDLKRLVLHDLEKLRYKDLGNDGRYAVDTSFMESLLLFEDQNPLFRRTASLD